MQPTDDSAAGLVPGVVKTAIRSFNSAVSLSQFAPARFSLLDGVHVAGLILKSGATASD
jgi:hypothetical protein